MKSLKMSLLFMELHDIASAHTLHAALKSAAAVFETSRSPTHSCARPPTQKQRRSQPSIPFSGFASHRVFLTSHDATSTSPDPGPGILSPRRRLRGRLPGVRGLVQQAHFVLSSAAATPAAVAPLSSRSPSGAPLGHSHACGCRRCGTAAARPTMIQDRLGVGSSRHRCGALRDGALRHPSSQVWPLRRSCEGDRSVPTCRFFFGDVRPRCVLV